MPRETKTLTIVHCVKLDADLPALDTPPFPGEMGERIYNEVSKFAYEMWPQQATLLINHYGLNMADPRAQEFLMGEMDRFFFGEGGQPPEGWSAPDTAPRKK